MILRLAGNPQIEALLLRRMVEPKKTLKRYKRKYREKEPAQQYLAGFSFSVFTTSVSIGS
jgi:hypothetical protein